MYNQIIIWIALFAFYLAFDFIFGLYLSSFEKRQKMRYANYSAVLTIMGIIGPVEVMKQGWEILIPIAAGVWAGSYLTVYLKKQK